jgi:hypothetical protein
MGTTRLKECKMSYPKLFKLLDFFVFVCGIWRAFLFLLVVTVVVFLSQVSLCTPGWTQIHDPPAATSKVHSYRGAPPLPANELVFKIVL